MNSEHSDLKGLRPSYVERLERLIRDSRLCPTGLIMTGPSLSRALLNAKNGRVSLSEAGTSFSFYAAGVLSDSTKHSTISVLPVFSGGLIDSVFVRLKLFVFNRVNITYQSEDTGLQDAFALASAMPLDSLAVTYCGTTKRIVYTESFERWLTSERPSPVPVFDFVDLACSEPQRKPTENVINAYAKVEKIAALYGSDADCELTRTLSSFIKSLALRRSNGTPAIPEGDSSLGGYVKQLPDLRALTYAQRLLLLKTVVLRDFLGNAGLNGASLFSHIKNVGSAKLKLGENKLDFSNKKECLSILGSCFNLNYFDEERQVCSVEAVTQESFSTFGCLFAGCSALSQEALATKIAFSKPVGANKSQDQVCYLNEPAYLKLWRFYGI